MSEFEDLSARAARLWLEFMQAQAKAAAAAASRLPEVTRSLAQAGVPLAAEVSRWIEGTPPAGLKPDEAQASATISEAEASAPIQTIAPAAEQKIARAPLMRANHRRLKAPKSLSRRRAPRT